MSKKHTSRGKLCRNCQLSSLWSPKYNFLPMSTIVLKWAKKTYFPREAMPKLSAIKLTSIILHLVDTCVKMSKKHTSRGKLCRNCQLSSSWSPTYNFLLMSTLVLKWAKNILPAGSYAEIVSYQAHDLPSIIFYLCWHLC